MISKLREFADHLTSSGDLPAVWREILFAVPRHEFIPECIWEHDDDELAPVWRDDDPQGWLRRVYTDTPIIIQADDGATAPGQRGRYVSSSASMPSLVFRMLTELDVRPGHRVLEIGTGTGWNAGLLAARLGSDQVVSIEVDLVLAEQAEKSLRGVGLTPTVITGDGTLGYPPGGPYDRVISTASVQRVPYAWVDQTLPGGVVLTPWGTVFDNSALVKLVVHADGTASGHFVAELSFMWLRDQRIPFGYLEDRVNPEGDAVESVTPLHPYEPLNNHDASFAIGVRVAGAQCLVVPDDDEDPYHYVVWLTDSTSGSWASLKHERGARTYPVRQHGPRRLWDEVAAAYQWWLDAGRPEYTRFGLTVSPAAQTVWLDHPGQKV